MTIAGRSASPVDAYRSGRTLTITEASRVPGPRRCPASCRRAHELLTVQRAPAALSTRIAARSGVEATHRPGARQAAHPAVGVGREASAARAAAAIPDRRTALKVSAVGPGAALALARVGGNTHPGGACERAHRPAARARHCALVRVDARAELADRAARSARGAGGRSRACAGLGRDAVFANTTHTRRSAHLAGLRSRLRALARERTRRPRSIRRRTALARGDTGVGTRGRAGIDVCGIGFGDAAGRHTELAGSAARFATHRAHAFLLEAVRVGHQVTSAKRAQGDPEESGSRTHADRERSMSRAASPRRGRSRRRMLVGSTRVRAERIVAGQAPPSEEPCSRT
jgi:hypothetical protein